MTARGLADRLVAKYGALASKQRVLARMHRHHALTQEAFGREHAVFVRVAARFALWEAVGVALRRREGVGHA